MNSHTIQLPRYVFASPEVAERYAEDTEAGLYDLPEEELFWQERYGVLLDHGYILRPRYHPNWKPSWTGTNRKPIYCEDSIMLMDANVIDATQSKSGLRVAIKSTQNNTREIEIAQYLSERRSIENHSVQLLEFFQDPLDPQMCLMVMPYLRPFNDPDFGTIGEAIDFIAQTLDGLVFLHNQRVAHRDIGAANVMMDGRPLYPNDHHPVRLTHSPDGVFEVTPLSRSEHPVRYYYIDFGLSSIFQEGEPPFVLGRSGRDKEVPELSHEIPYNAYKVDIFALGSLYNEELVTKYHGLGFLQPLIESMRRQRPDQRPTAEAARAQFYSIYEKLDSPLLRWRLSCRTESAPERVMYDTVAVAKEGIYHLKRLMT